MRIEFAQKSDIFFDFGVIATHSFTEEIGEYLACWYLTYLQNRRRLIETRRLNNLAGKTANYLFVVTLNNSFKFTWNLQTSEGTFLIYQN